MNKEKNKQHGLEELNIAICGVGGQGNLLLERILCNSLLEEGYVVRAADTFGAAQRGGSVISHVRIGANVRSCLIPEGKCDILVGLEPGETLRASGRLLRENGLILVNVSAVLPTSVKVGKCEYPSKNKIMDLLTRVSPKIIELNATEIAYKTTGTERAMNVVMLGVLAGLGIIPVRAETFREKIRKLTRNSASANMQAFEEGLRLGSGSTMGK